MVLGFAHEEEFVILSLAVGVLSPVLLMIAYASAVSASLIAVTVLGVKVYERIQNKVLPYVKYLPKISALILVAMAVVFALQLMNETGLQGLDFRSIVHHFYQHSSIIDNTFECRSVEQPSFTTIDNQEAEATR